MNARSIHKRLYKHNRGKSFLGSDRIYCALRVKNLLAEIYPEYAHRPDGVVFNHYNGYFLVQVGGKYQLYDMLSFDGSQAQVIQATGVALDTVPDSVSWLDIEISEWEEISWQEVPQVAAVVRHRMSGHVLYDLIHLSETELSRNLGRLSGPGSSTVVIDGNDIVIQYTIKPHYLLRFARELAKAMKFLKNTGRKARYR